MGGVGLIGHSRGGGAAILAAAAETRVKALVTWSAISTVARFSEEALQEWRESGSMRVENGRTGDVFQLAWSVAEDTVENLDKLDILSAAARLSAPVIQ